jgi:hypothetical protein
MTSIIITRNQKKAFADMRWLAEAASDDSTKPFMCDIIHVETDGGQKVLVATDGRRLHKLTLNYYESDISEGDYTVVKKSDIITLTPKTDIQFINWQRVIPERKTELYRNERIDVKANRYTDIAFTVYKLNRIGIVVRHDFIKALSGFTWTISQATGKRSGALFFECENHLALIMPMQTAEVDRAVEEAEKRLSEPVAPVVETAKEPETPVLDTFWSIFNERCGTRFKIAVAKETKPDVKIA